LREERVVVEEEQVDGGLASEAFVLHSMVALLPRTICLAEVMDYSSSIY